jgi:hypothetical protein
LKGTLLPSITTTKDVIDTQNKIGDYKKNRGSGEEEELLPLSQMNLAFSFSGLMKLGLKVEEIPTGGNGVFSKGQKVDAVDNLGDPVDQATQKLKTWSEDFQVNSIDLVVLITASDSSLLNEKLNQVRYNLSEFLSSSFLRQGKVRPGSQRGHEHFGYLVESTFFLFLFCHTLTNFQLDIPPIAFTNCMIIRVHIQRTVLLHRRSRA